jgi:arylsulfatase A-like enzyme
VRVAAFANWPGVIPAGKKVDQPMHVFDWYPTFVKLAGGSLEQKLPLDGRDIWPVLTQGAKSPHDELILNAEPTVGAIRMGDWKLVVHHGADDGEAVKPKPKAKRKPSGAKIELFNLRGDPGENENLADREPDRVKAMQARLDFYTKQAAPSRQATPGKDFKAPRVWGE